MAPRQRARVLQPALTLRSVDLPNLAWLTTGCGNTHQSARDLGDKKNRVVIGPCGAGIPGRGLPREDRDRCAAAQGQFPHRGRNPREEPQPTVVWREEDVAGHDAFEPLRFQITE